MTTSMQLLNTDHKPVTFHSEADLKRLLAGMEEFFNSSYLILEDVDGSFVQAAHNHGKLTLSVSVQ